MQFIAGIVEHRISEEFASQTFFVNMLSFIARTINSYWGTQVTVISFFLSPLYFLVFLRLNLAFLLFFFLGSFEKLVEL